jgi:CheY-like chemotaxis protein
MTNPDQQHAVDSKALWQSSQSSQKGTKRRQRSLHVVIVEDNAHDAELMASELRKHGFEFTWARVVTEAEFAEHLAGQVDLILADYTVPGFGATRALEILQERGLLIPFVVVSGTI